MQSINSTTDTLPLSSPAHEPFRLLVVQAIQRSGANCERQRQACRMIDTVLPETLREETYEQAVEIAARCLQLTRPANYKPQKNRQRPQPKHPWSGRRDTLVIALMREVAVVHLRENQHLSFREISSHLNLRGPDRIRSIYARACRRREQVVRLLSAPEPADASDAPAIMR